MTQTICSGKTLIPGRELKHGSCLSAISNLYTSGKTLIPGRELKLNNCLPCILDLLFIGGKTLIPGRELKRSQRSIKNPYLKMSVERH